MDQARVQEFLDRIGQIESAGGKYTDHKTLQSGMHKGQSAIGTYGLMPQTVDELANRSDDPKIRALKSMSDDEKRKLLAPGSELERQLAMQLAEQVLTKQGGDEQKAAFAWLYGHNLPPEEIEKRGYLDKDYVQKYSKLANMMHNRTPASMPSDEVLALNDSQKQETAKAIEKLSKEELFIPMEEPVATKIPEAMMTPVEPEQQAKPVQIAIPRIQAGPRFNHINDLIQSYKNIRK